jgi:hypothetical protein
MQPSEAPTPEETVPIKKEKTAEVGEKPATVEEEKPKVCSGSPLSPTTS